MMGTTRWPNVLSFISERNTRTNAIVVETSMVPLVPSSNSAYALASGSAMASDGTTRLGKKPPKAVRRSLA